MHSITMPKLSDSMEMGKIVRWLVKEGDEVHTGADKATMELECFRDGRIAKIMHGDETEAAVGDTIALIAEEGEEAQAPEEAAVPAEVKEYPAPRKAPEPVKPPVLGREGGHVAISPFARKLAEQKGIDYTGIRGSGPGGRIVARDVERADEADASAPAKPGIDTLTDALLKRYGYDASTISGTGEGGSVTLDDAIGTLTGKPPVKLKPSPDEELSPLDIAPDEADVVDAPFMLKTIARRVTASKHVIPHFYITRGVDVTELFKRKDALKEQYGATITHLVMLACLKTLAAHPEVNRTYEREKIINWKGIHLGLAIDTDAGLSVAVLRNAQQISSLAEIVEKTSALVEKARSGKLSAEERRHPTFTISNLGMFDVEHFQPIVNPPSSITLAVASALPAALIRGESIAIAKVMKLTLSCDHRIVDGAAAARFLRDLKAALEDPDSMLGE